MREIIRWILLVGSTSLATLMVFEAFERGFYWEDDGWKIIIAGGLLMNALFLYHTRVAFDETTFGLWLKVRRARFKKEIDDIENTGE